MVYSLSEDTFYNQKTKTSLSLFCNIFFPVDSTRDFLLILKGYFCSPSSKHIPLPHLRRSYHLRFRISVFSRPTQTS